MKNRIRNVLIVLLVLVLGVASYYFYRINNPTLYFYYNVVDYPDDYYAEFYAIGFGYHSSMPMAKSIAEKIDQIGDWTYEMDLELLTGKYIAPTHVEVEGEVANGKTIIRYVGYVTDTDGVREDFFEERVFDFTLGTQEEMFPSK